MKKESFEKGREVEATPDIGQNSQGVVVGKRIPVGSMKGYMFNTKNMQNLFNSPIFDTSIKVAYGLGLILGELSTFSIPFPPLPTESINIEPPKVSMDISNIHIPTPPFSTKPLLKQQRINPRLQRRRSRHFILTKSCFSQMQINFREL